MRGRQIVAALVVAVYFGLILTFAYVVSAHGQNVPIGGGQQQLGALASCIVASFQPGERRAVRVPVTWVVGNEPVLPSVIDNADPAYLAADGILAPDGTTTVVYVFNHDAVSARTGRVCVTAVR